MDFLSCTCKNTAQHSTGATGSSLTRPSALAGSRLQENVYLLSFKNWNPEKTQEVPVEGRGQESTQWGKDVKFLLDNQEGHSLGGGGAQKRGDCWREGMWSWVCWWVLFSFPSSSSIISWPVMSILLSVDIPINLTLIRPVCPKFQAGQSLFSWGGEQT